MHVLYPYPSSFQLTHRYTVLGRTNSGTLVINDTTSQLAGQSNTILHPAQSARTHPMSVYELPFGGQRDSGRM